MDKYCTLFLFVRMLIFGRDFKDSVGDDLKCIGS